MKTIAAYIQFVGINPETKRMSIRMVELYLDPHFCLDELVELVQNLPCVTRVALYDDNGNFGTPFAVHNVIPFGTAHQYFD